MWWTLSKVVTFSTHDICFQFVFFHGTRNTSHIKASQLFVRPCLWLYCEFSLDSKLEGMVSVKFVIYIISGDDIISSDDKHSCADKPALLILRFHERPCIWFWFDLSSHNIWQRQYQLETLWHSHKPSQKYLFWF